MQSICLKLSERAASLSPLWFVLLLWMAGYSSWGGRHLFFAGVLDKLYRGLFKRGYLSGMLRTYQLYNIGRTYRIDEKIAC